MVGRGFDSDWPPAQTPGARCRRLGGPAANLVVLGQTQTEAIYGQLARIAFSAEFSGSPRLAQILFEEAQADSRAGGPAA